jgi:CDGSH-type Zn-finger protein
MSGKTRLEFLDQLAMVRVVTGCINAFQVRHESVDRGKLWLHDRDVQALHLGEPECAVKAANALRIMQDVTIKVRESGPYLVTGTVTLIDADGNPYVTEEKFVLCRCGGSKTKPFCDASHRTNGFVAEERAPKSETQ